MFVAYHDLGDPGCVAKVKESHATVIAPARHPAGERDSLTGMLGTQVSCRMGAEHDVVPSVGGKLTGGADPTEPTTTARTA
jgi:hypothetical protein